MPIDLQVADQSIDGALSIVDVQAIPNTSVGISIGPKTIELYRQKITQAKTIFYNGLMGFQERPETLQGMHALLQAMTNSHAFTSVGGGDTVGAAESLGFADSLSFCSTGGGTTLSYLSGQPLPGIEALINP
jgi:phosphoglycerate kinase